MIDFHTFQLIHQLHARDQLSIAQIARQLSLHPETVAKWVKRPRYEPRKPPRRPSKLDEFRPEIVRLLHHHPYSAQQIYQRLRDMGYDGCVSVVRERVRELRPPPSKAFLTLRFLPGQCAQVDWGHAGWLACGATRRRLSFFVMVLAYSRKLYVEFTLGQAMEFFLSAHQNALEYFGGVPAEVWVDNCKTAVLDHPLGGPVTFHPRFVDLAQHYGFQIKACAPRQPQQKGRVESAVGYIKGNFLRGLDLSSLDALNVAARHWMENVANLRLHAETRRTPADIFAEELPRLRPVNPVSYDASVLVDAAVNSRARVVFETNRYSVPWRYASQQVLLKIRPDRIMVYHQDRPIADHARSFERHQDIERPEHLEELLAIRRQGRRQQQLTQFLALCSGAENYLKALQQKRVNPHHHIQKILALAEHYGRELTARALEDALAFEAFGAEYLTNLLEQRARPRREPGALHLTRQQDLLELEIPQPDLSLYEAP
jgi:transposase